LRTEREWIVTDRRSFDTESHMTTLTRWKLACGLFAALAGIATVHAHHGDRNTPAAVADAPSRAQIPASLRRPIHVTPESIGVSQKDLVDRILSAHSVKDVQLLAEKLGAVGDDDAIDTLSGLLGDPRKGVPEALLGAFGNIATDHAVDVLIEHTKDERPSVRNAAIGDLGSTQSARAEKLLLELATKSGDPAQSVAMSALGTLGTDHAVEALKTAAISGDYQIATTAVYALASAHTPASDAALRQLIN